jgi:predicted AlkP superfamily phosphohydrolase/phosphomutase
MKTKTPQIGTTSSGPPPEDAAKPHSTSFFEGGSGGKLFSPKKVSPRLAMIGLDGVGLDLARSLAGRGVMPVLGRLLEGGAAWPTDSPLPEVSPVCWTSMFSGAEPGEHGVFGFGEHRPGTYQVAPVDSGAVRAPRIWEDLSARGRPSLVLGVPLTYPATAINGVMLSGFVCPDLERGVHPPELLPRLRAMGYRAEADLDRGREDPAGMLADVDQALEVRLKVYGELIRNQPWDFLAAVITDTDRVNHFAWPALHEAAHPLAGAALGVYRRVDRFLGEMLELWEPELKAGRLKLLIAADHSFGPIRSEVYLNPWLESEGLLQVDGPPGAERILPASSALALDPGRIYLHRAGRFPAGSIQPGREAEDLLARIAAGLGGLTFRQVVTTGGEPRLESVRPVARVHWGRELYHGPNARQAPDLVAEPAEGFSLRAGLGRGGVFGLSHLSGTHRPSGALALWHPGPPPLPPPQRVSGLHGLMTRVLGL